MPEHAAGDGKALINVREAAHLTGRSPETVRRWVWSGRLAASRQGHRLLISRSEALALGAARSRVLPTSLADWASEAKSVLAKYPLREWKTAADLVVGDRAARSGAARQS
ncbi:MAG TPA: helix-turn-helix domain-containing protein [Candidatus Dormibacteraeota bacterium]|nr:helix-turn-helix domain-containing protein [Candidatus Dormibacteraeota bacterium]